MNRLTTQRWLIRILMAACLLAMVGETTAQRNGDKGKGPKISTAGLKGTITAVANGLFQVKGKHDGVKWVVKPEGLMQYLGTAPKEWLRPGMVVMVSGTFDRKGMATFPVAQIQAFTPRPGRVMGVVDDPSGLGGPVEKNAPKSLIVSGPIKAIEDGNLIIMSGRKKITVPMAENVDVTVDLIGDLRWVKAGDEVVGKVEYVQKGQGRSTELSVTGSEELKPPPPAPLTKKEQRIKAMREKKAAAAAEKAAAKEAAAAGEPDAESATEVENAER